MPWNLFFYRAGSGVEVGDDPVLARHAAVVERLRDRRVRPGSPFLLDPDGMPDRRVNGWFVSEEMLGLSALTWRKYAFALKVWLNFLEACGVSWMQAGAEAVEAFKTWRMVDERNSRCVTPGTHVDSLVALRQFYLWAAQEHGVGNPIRMRRGRGRRRDGTPVEQAATAPSGVRDRDVKWFDPAGYARYRDLGLLGLTVDGEDDPAWRGRNPQRDAVFADGLYGTGLRLQEWGSLVLAELPADDPARGFSTCVVAASTAKGGYGRPYWMPRRVLTDVLSYVEGERGAAVRRAQAAGRYERLPDARVVTEAVGRRLRLRPADR